MLITNMTRKLCMGDREASKESPERGMDLTEEQENSIKILMSMTRKDG